MVFERHNRLTFYWIEDILYEIYAIISINVLVEAVLNYENENTIRNLQENKGIRYFILLKGIKYAFDNKQINLLNRHSPYIF